MVRENIPDIINYEDEMVGSKWMTFLYMEFTKMLFWSRESKQYWVLWNIKY